MMKRGWRYLLTRYPWLNAKHPIAQRDLRFAEYAIVPFIQRLTEARNILSYAAMLHGVLFVIAILTYTRGNGQIPAPIAPFLTPFGTPIMIGFFHSVLYWAMVIGVINQTTYNFGRDLSSGTWTALRSTPFTVGELLLAKLTAVRATWTPILRILIWTRVVAALFLPVILAIDLYKTDMHLTPSTHFLLIIPFIFQPLIDGFVAGCIACLSVFITRHTMWARVLAYSLTGAVMGGCALLSGLWLVMASPAGALATLLVPLNHWALFVASMVRFYGDIYYILHWIIMLAAFVVLPLMVAYGAWRFSIRLAMHR